MVERHLSLAQDLAELVDGEPELERLADVPAEHRVLRALAYAEPPPDIR